MNIILRISGLCLIVLNNENSATVLFFNMAKHPHPHKPILSFDPEASFEGEERPGNKKPLHDAFLNFDNQPIGLLPLEEKIISFWIGDKPLSPSKMTCELDKVANMHEGSAGVFDLDSRNLERNRRPQHVISRLDLFGGKLHVETCCQSNTHLIFHPETNDPVGGQFADFVTWTYPIPEKESRPFFVHANPFGELRRNEAFKLKFDPKKLEGKDILMSACNQPSYPSDWHHAKNLYDLCLLGPHRKIIHQDERRILKPVFPDSLPFGVIRGGCNPVYIPGTSIKTPK